LTPRKRQFRRESEWDRSRDAAGMCRRQITAHKRMSRVSASTRRSAHESAASRGAGFSEETHP